MFIIILFLVFQALNSRTKMNKFAYCQNGFVSFREIDVSKGVVCPKPRESVANQRFNTNATFLQIKYVFCFFFLFLLLLFSVYLYLFGYFISQEVEFCDLKAETDILDLILTEVTLL